MKRLSKNSILSVILASLAISFFLIFIASGSFIPLIIAAILLVSSGFARKRESYEDYRDRYEQKFGMSEDEDTASDDNPEKPTEG